MPVVNFLISLFLKLINFVFNEQTIQVAVGGLWIFSTYFKIIKNSWLIFINVRGLKSAI